MGTATFVEILLAILLPPLGVFLKFNCNAEFWVCLILTLFGYIPGIIYALYAVTRE
ncbi:unnamed protein product [Brassica oleracea]|uniref:Uncharacterized protein n=2 Tax=Brassica TaxID=3705 RepID=A0A8X7TN56_BRACI|nr:hypothetical protein Bca52824_087848 [Brassica carinata]